MELELTRVDYTLVGLTSQKSMKLLPPPAPKQTQKVAIGDQDGVLHIFLVKKGEIQTILKTPPGPKISRLELGGALGYPRDKVFISCENEVKGFSKKGKQFLGFDTNLTEPIKSMYIEGSDLLVCGQHNFNHYQDCKDANNFVCADVINDVTAFNALKTNRLTPILACDDRVLRILDHSHVLHAISISGSPTVLHLFQNDGGDTGDQVLFGTSNGGVGLLQLGRGEMKNSWILEPDENKGQVTCLDCYDMTGDGTNELIVGRDDGYIEVYTIPYDLNSSPKQIFSYTCNETVTSVVCGIVGNTGFDEIVVVTYSGWVFGLTTEILGKTVSLSTDANNIRLSQEAKQKMIRLRNEIEELEEKISKERDRYQTTAQDNEFAVSAIPFVAINDKFYLNKEDASYSLCLEVQTSIDNVLIQSDVPVDLLDVEKNSAVVSFSDCDPGDGNFLLATYRCQLNTTRLDLKIRTIEGQYGILQTYVTPNIQPKCCQVRQYRIKPLSLHTRSHMFDPKRPYNVLHLKGGFSMAEMHAWIEYCLPEVPEKPPPGETAILIFVSTFLDTTLQCTYGKGEAEFKSDNISTISILKDVLSKEAIRSNKKRNLDITWSISDESITHTLNLLRPKLEHQLDLVRKMTILESMTELDITEIQNDSTLLTDEYLEIIKNEKEIVEEYKRQPAYLDRLYGMITDLFIDKYKFQGINVKGKIAALLELLERERYSYEELLKFFHQ